MTLPLQGRGPRSRELNLDELEEVIMIMALLKCMLMLHGGGGTRRGDDGSNCGGIEDGDDGDGCGDDVM